jgi:hypothetical protein
MTRLVRWTPTKGRHEPPGLGNFIKLAPDVLMGCAVTQACTMAEVRHLALSSLQPLTSMDCAWSSGK